MCSNEPQFAGSVDLVRVTGRHVVDERVTDVTYGVIEIFRE